MMISTETLKSMEEEIQYWKRLAHDEYWTQVKKLQEEVVELKSRVCEHCEFYRSSVHSKHLLCMTAKKDFGCNQFKWRVE